MSGHGGRCSACVVAILTGVRDTAVFALLVSLQIRSGVVRFIAVLARVLDAVMFASFMIYHVTSGDVRFSAEFADVAEIIVLRLLVGEQREAAFVRFPA